MTSKMTRKGFTLLEVMIAMIILAGSMVALSKMWSGTMFSFRKSQNVNTIVGLLKKKTTELEIKYKELGFDEIPDSESGGFESDSGQNVADLTWTSEVKELEFPDLSALLTSQDGGANEMLLGIVDQMTDYFSKNLKELRVTVVWTSKGKELKYHVTTYLSNSKAGGVSVPGMGGASDDGKDKNDSKDGGG